MNPVRPSTPPLPDLTESLTCPITLQVPKDPVVAADGYLYERSAIEAWLREHTTSPVTNQPFVSRVLYSIYPLRSGLGGAALPAPEPVPALPEQTAQQASLLGTVDAFCRLDASDRAHAEEAQSNKGLAARQALMRLVAAHDKSDELLQTQEPLPEILGAPLAALAQRAVDPRVRQAAVNHLGSVCGMEAIRFTLAIFEAAPDKAALAQAKAQLFGVVPRLQSLEDDRGRSAVDAFLQALAQNNRLPEEVGKQAVWALLERSQHAPVRREVYARLRDIARDATTAVATAAAQALLRDAAVNDADYATDAAVYLAATARLRAVRTLVRSWKVSAT